MTDVHTMPAGNGRRLRSGSYRRTRRKTCFGCRPGDSHGWLFCELTLEAAQRHKRLQDLKKGYLTTNTTKQSPALPNRTVLEHRGTHSGTAAAREALSLASGPETEPSRTHAQAQALAHTHTAEPRRTGPHDQNVVGSPSPFFKRKIGRSLPLLFRWGFVYPDLERDGSFLES